jgi:hypothetical protein
MCLLLMLRLEAKLNLHEEINLLNPLLILLQSSVRHVVNLMLEGNFALVVEENISVLIYYHFVF